MHFIYLQAEKIGTKQLDEDGLLDLIRTLPGKKSKYEIQAQKSIKVRILRWIFCQNIFI